ncbi:hypothetical protein [Aquimarina sp. I32.4]|uniref:hypothetical protein n=1 Tax=Aquimarina sp. I32.4 TaxID=2053903 RepID=UPI000CDEC6FE|nr:hypothetical protein [Aquimarina sp. I32.4]
MEQNFVEILSGVIIGIIGPIAQILILISCLYYVAKKGISPSGVLLVIGSILELLCAIASLIGAFYVSRQWGVETYAKLIMGVNVISIIARIIFTIGFILLIRKVVSVKKQN